MKTFSIIKTRLIGTILAVAATAAAIAAEPPVSYYKQVVPIFKKSCHGCHHPGKMKGDLDLTTHAALLKGGKHGVVLKAGEPKSSPLFEEISGPEPSMPEDGDPLSQEQVALIERWIAEGGIDDTPADKLNPYKLAGPPVYTASALISALSYSPDGNTIAISGYHEVILYKPDGSERLGRLLGEAPKIDSFAFSSDGKWLAVSASAPAVFGEVQIWDVAERKQVKAWRVSNDSVYGVSFSPDNSRIAFAGADKSVRVLNFADGKEVMKFDNHSDWVFGTAFTLEGDRLLSAGRDKAMKLIHIANAQFIDDINKLLEEIVCISRHPKENTVVYGGAMGHARIYRISENQGRTVANNDANLLRTFERYPGAIHAVAYSPDGTQIALGGVGTDEVRVYKTDGTRTATLKGHEGAIFSIAWHPTKPEIMTGGHEGEVRIFDAASGSLLSSFNPFPTAKESQVATR